MTSWRSRPPATTPHLMIGPWTHTSSELLGAGVREGLAWLRARLLDDDRLVRPARVQRVRHRRARRRRVARAARVGRHRAPSERRLWLGDDGRPRPPNGPERPEPTRYRYDPADPTPSVGGPVLLVARAGRGQPRARGPGGRAHVHDGAAGRVAGGDRAGSGRAVRAFERAGFRRVRARVRRRHRGRVVERLRRAGPRRHRAGSSSSARTCGASSSSYGRARTASRPVTESAFRSPPAPTRGTPATPAPARTRTA